MTQDGRYLKNMMIPDKWRYLIHAPFKVSEKCCDVMKKEPFALYEKETGRKPLSGVMADEGQNREKSYLKTGCNSFKKGHEMSRPLGFWIRQDVLKFIYEHRIPYSDIYGEIKLNSYNQTYYTTGEQRTGCIFCMFGCDQECEPNRFQRLAVSHPKLHSYCIHNLGMGEVLDYLRVPYEDRLIKLF